MRAGRRNEEGSVLLVVFFVCVAAAISAAGRVGDPTVRAAGGS